MQALSVAAIVSQFPPSFQNRFQQYSSMTHRRSLHGPARRLPPARAPCTVAIVIKSISSLSKQRKQTANTTDGFFVSDTGAKTNMW